MMPCRMLGVLLFCVALSGIPAYSQQFWFSPQDAVTVKLAHETQPADFMQLFPADASWGVAAGKLSVFKVPAQFVLSATDDMLRTVFNGMKQRHVKMAVEIGTVVRLDSCGLGEGYAPAGLSGQVGKRLHDLNLTLDYMAADEPVFYAHLKTWGTAKDGRPNCAYPLSVVADRVAISVAEMRKYFPRIEIGEIDVLGNDPQHPIKQVEAYTEFARLLESRIGQKLAFFHADLAWKMNPLPLVAPLKRAMEAQGVPFGVIIGGGPKDMTDVAWDQDGLDRLSILTRDLEMRPSQVVVQSWQPRPLHILPETTPGTLTYLLRQAENLSTQLRK